MQVEQQQEEEQQRSYEEQSVLALEDRKSALLRAMTSSHSGGPGETTDNISRPEHCRAGRIILVGVLSGSGPGTEASDEALQGRLEDLDRSFTFPQSALAVQLSTARAGLSYCPEARAFLQANWPIREQHGRSCDARYQVFRDLRGRGFYLTSAGKFGGDFLVYPGERGHTCLSL